MADLLEWILQEQGVTFLLHYLDDYLTLGHPGSKECYNNLRIILSTCKILGIPLAIEKVEGPKIRYHRHSLHGGSAAN